MIIGGLQQRRGLSQLAHLALMANLEKDNRDIEERMNAPMMVLRQGTPISDISGRDLPSPADIKGDNNVLLLPYYQELEKRETFEDNFSTVNSNTKSNQRSKSSLPL